MECAHEPGDKINVYMSWNKAGEKSNTRRKIVSIIHGISGSADQ